MFRGRIISVKRTIKIAINKIPMKVFVKNKSVLYGALIIGLGYLTTHLSHDYINQFIDHNIPFLKEYYVEEAILWIGISVVYFCLHYLYVKNRQYKSQIKEVHDSMLYASNHIVRNFLYQTQMVQMEANESEDFDPEVLELLGESAHEAELMIRQLSEVKEMDPEAILNSLHVKEAV